MSPNHPEYNYLRGEQAAELAEAQVGDGRELWSPEDNVLLSTAEELDWQREHQGEYIAETGADIFYGCGPECRNGSFAISEATRLYNEKFARHHLGLSQVAIDRRYATRYARA